VWDGEEDERPGDLLMTNPEGACKDFLRGMCKRITKGACKFEHTLALKGVHEFVGRVKEKSGRGVEGGRKARGARGSSASDGVKEETGRAREEGENENENEG
jgi:hypothetical protein